ncbi:MAG: hypothetical protein GY816_05070 [Cytophagales bacterium]|nr:hypothetical protein [Cytophagales bacterium]
MNIQNINKNERLVSEISLFAVTYVKIEPMVKHKVNAVLKSYLILTK